MRQLIKIADYSFVAGTRLITIANNAAFTADDVRLIINETQKEVITSSMQKDLITVSGAVITYSNTLPVLAAGDKLTIEIDFGVASSVALLNDVTDGKVALAGAITTKGVASTSADSFGTMATKIINLPTNPVTVSPIQNYPSNFHDLFEVMAANYDITKPYMYALLLIRDTPTAILDMLLDGTKQVKGGESDANKVTRYCVFFHANQLGFSFAYTSTFAKYIIGIAVYNADIQNVNFNGSKPTFLYYNTGYTVSNLVYTLNQFNGTSIININIPGSSTLTLYDNVFYGSKASYCTINEGITELTIAGASIWYQDSNLIAFILPNSLRSLTIPAAYWNIWGGSALIIFKFPNLLTTLVINGGAVWMSCTSLPSFVFPNSLTYLIISGQQHWMNCTSMNYFYLPMVASFTISGSGHWSGCSSLTKFELGTNWDWAINISSCPALTAANIETYIFNKLKDNTGFTAKTLTLPTRNNTGGADPLSAAQKLIATNKNWTLAFA